MISRNMPATASCDSGPLFISTTRRRTSASRSGRYAGPLLSSPMACACAARSETMRSRSRSSASIAARRRLSSFPSSPDFSFAVIRARRRPKGATPASLAVLFFGLDHALEARQLLALAEVDERHSLSRAPHLPDRPHARADEHAAGRDEHHFVLRADERCGDDLAVAPALLDRDHALGAAAMPRVFHDRRALAEAVLGRRQDRLLLVLGNQHADHLLTLVEQHAAHAVRHPAHRPDVA